MTDQQKTLCCPSCQEADRLATIEDYEGYAECLLVTAQGPEWNGVSEVIYDTATTVGIWCRNCEWEYRGSDWLDQLVPAGI